MELNTNILIFVLIFLCYIIVFLVIKTLINKASTLDEIFANNNKRLVFILSLLKNEIKADFDNLKEIKGVKQNLILGDMLGIINNKKINKVEKQESKRIKRRSTLVRKEACTYLGLIGSNYCRETLEKALIKEKDVSVKIYISNALTDIRNPRSLNVMIPSILNEKKWYREKAISNVLEFGYDIQAHFLKLQNAKDIEYIELWLNYANENINTETKQYLFHFVDHFEDIKVELQEYYTSRQAKGERGYKIKFLVEDMDRLLVFACETLSKYYVEEFSEPTYYNSENEIIQEYSFLAMSLIDKRENFEKLFSFINQDKYEKMIIKRLTSMVEKNSKYLGLLEDLFENEESYIIKSRIAQILSNKIEYYILKLNTKNNVIAENIIIEIVKNGKVSELIGFFNRNNDYDVENRLMQIIKDHLDVNGETGKEIRRYLKEDALLKWGIEPIYRQKEARKKVKDAKLSKVVIVGTCIVFVFFPILFYVLNYNFVLSNISREVIKKYVIDFNYYLAFYSIAVNLVYVTLMLLSYQNVKRQSRLWDLKNISMLFRKKMIPTISVIAPAYNEEKTIVESANSLLNLSYPEYELIIVNDGSEDETLNILIKTFDLVRVDYSYAADLSTAPILGIYKNPSLPNLVVIDKSNGGKADSLNAGINVSSKTYFCGIDADSLLESDALLKLASLSLDESREIPAMGGNICPINGCTVDKGSISKVQIPKNPIARFQTIEYLRSFMAGRLGWEKISSLLIISGAFGLFRKERIVGIGGYLTERGKYKKDTVGEDMELVVRISRHMHEIKQSFKIRYSFNANCWTEVPEDLKSLKTQRYRWHRGLIDILYFHRKMLFNPRYGTTGLVSLPYFFIFEAIGPIIEVQGYIMVVLAGIWGILNIEIALLLFITVILFGVIVSLTSLLIAEREQQYFSVSDIFKLIGFAIIENFGVRQLISLWRVGGQLSIVFGKGGWGQVKRKGQKNE